MFGYGLNDWLQLGAYSLYIGILSIAVCVAGNKISDKLVKR
jgi:hypothetical protein